MPIKFNAVSVARNLAIWAHQDQKYNGDPYVVHLDRVADLCQSRSLGSDKDFMAVAAYLHDLLEDTHVDLDLIGAIFKGLYSMQLFKVLRLVTRDKDSETYDDYIKRIAISGNLEAIHLKLSDLEANLEAFSSSKCTKPESLRVRYRKAHAILSAKSKELEDWYKEWKQTVAYGTR